MSFLNDNLFESSVDWTLGADNNECAQADLKFLKNNNYKYKVNNANDFKTMFDSQYIIDDLDSQSQLHSNYKNLLTKDEHKSTDISACLNHMNQNEEKENNENIFVDLDEQRQEMSNLLSNSNNINLAFSDVMRKFNTNIQNSFASSLFNSANQLMKFNQDQLTTSLHSSMSLANEMHLSQNQHEDESTKTIKIHEDDLIDCRSRPRAVFKNWYEKYECSYDPSQSFFATNKIAKMTKSLQRKLANLCNMVLNQQFQIYNDQSFENSAYIQQLISTNNFKELCNISIQNQDFKKKYFRLMRSIVERVLIDSLVHCDHYHNQLIQIQQIYHMNGNNHVNIDLTNPIKKLWNELRSRGCQFLGPQMQDDVLHLIFHALETMQRMSRKVLVAYVFYSLVKHYPKASKTNIGHVVQILYRGGCFKVEKRENDSSLMELKKEYLKYATLRREHDTQIIQIALEGGIRMSPEQWSQKLYGDSNHKSEMQSIIDTLQSSLTLEKHINDFYKKLTSYKKDALGNIFINVKPDFDFFASINFEKKQASAQSNGKKFNSSDSNHDDSFTNMMGSESTNSEDDCFSNEFYDDEFETVSTTNDSLVGSDKLRQTSKLKQLHHQQQQQEQTKITWSLIDECMMSTVRILTAHVEYSSKIIPLINENSTSLSKSLNSNQAHSNDMMSNRNKNSMMNNQLNHKVNHQKQTRILSNNNTIMNPNNMNNVIISSNNQISKHVSKNFNPEVDAFQPQNSLNTMNVNYNSTSNMNTNLNSANNSNYLRSMGPDVSSFNNVQRRFHIKNNNQQRYNKYGRSNNFNNNNNNNNNAFFN
jgi:hypothetical protein